MKKLILGPFQACFCVFDSTTLACLIAAIIVLLTGCVSRPKYIEGTMTQVGLYIPVESNIYGLQILNYLNGCSISAASNQTLKVEREFCSTNSYFGIVNTVEYSKTKAEVK